MESRFNLYDFFATLIPGIFFNFLLVFTITQISGQEFYNWKGNIGDATIFIMSGFVAGTFLQGIAKVIVHKPARKILGGRYLETLIQPNSTKFSKNFKAEVIKTIENKYGKIFIENNTPKHRKLLNEKIFRAYKKIYSEDATTRRFLAEVHSMRAYITIFILLLAVSLYFQIFLGCNALLFIFIYFLGFIFSLWRFHDKSITWARHSLISIVETDFDN